MTIRQRSFAHGDSGMTNVSTPPDFNAYSGRIRRVCNAADVGISTCNAVDVAQEAADFVLLEKDLSVLADGILEGRKSFANSMKYILITAGATFARNNGVISLLITIYLPVPPGALVRVFSRSYATGSGATGYSDGVYRNG